MIVDFLQYMIKEADRIGEDWQSMYMTAIKESIEGLSEEDAESKIRQGHRFHRNQMHEKNISKYDFQMEWTKALNFEQVIRMIDGELTWEEA